jgi:hypothetical protein
MRVPSADTQLLATSIHIRKGDGPHSDHNIESRLRDLDDM